MRLSQFESCIPALLRQLGFAPSDNPGQIPLPVLTLCGAITVREQQLDSAEQTVSILALETLELHHQVARATEFMALANSEILKMQREADRQQRAYEAQYRLALSYEGSLHEANRALRATQEKLTIAENKLACIEAVTRREGAELDGSPPATVLLQ